MPATLTMAITYGDSDPARIVFFPNAFRWMDAALHNLLRDVGGHATVCERQEAIGLGVTEAQATFRRPIRDRDGLELQVSFAASSARSVTLTYEGTVGDAVAFTGRKVRRLFTRTGSGIVATDLSPLREMMNARDV